MRLDKFLKLSRLVKRRTVANELSAAGGVKINGKIAKPSAEVHKGDILTLDLGQRLLEVKIEEVPSTNVPANAALSLYTVITEVYNNSLSK